MNATVNAERLSPLGISDREFERLLDHFFDKSDKSSRKAVIEGLPLSEWQVNALRELLNNPSCTDDQLSVVVRLIKFIDTPST
jgi:hypothetical protein